MRFVTRSQWGAIQATGGTPRPLGLVRGVCYHHTVTPQPSLFRSGPSIVRLVQKEHMVGRGYSDIAYNALIGPSGRIYEGRPLEMLGAHSDGTYKGQHANAVLLGVAFLGNYQTDTLTQKAIDAALGLEYLWSLKLGHPLEVSAHQLTKATACPGTSVMDWLHTRGI